MECRATNSQAVVASHSSTMHRLPLRLERPNCSQPLNRVRHQYNWASDVLVTKNSIDQGQVRDLQRDPIPLHKLVSGSNQFCRHLSRVATQEAASLRIMDKLPNSSYWSFTRKLTLKLGSKQLALKRTSHRLKNLMPTALRESHHLTRNREWVTRGPLRLTYSEWSILVLSQLPSRVTWQLPRALLCYREATSMTGCKLVFRGKSLICQPSLLRSWNRKNRSQQTLHRLTFMTLGGEVRSLQRTSLIHSRVTWVLVRLVTTSNAKCRLTHFTWHNPIHSTAAKLTLPQLISVNRSIWIKKCHCKAKLSIQWRRRTHQKTRKDRNRARINSWTIYRWVELLKDAINQDWAQRNHRIQSQRTSWILLGKLTQIRCPTPLRCQVSHHLCTRQESSSSHKKKKLLPANKNHRQQPEQTITIAFQNK